MPKIVRLAPNLDYKPSTPEEKATFAAVKARGKFDVSWVTAMENIKNSGGMLAVDYVEPVAVPEPGPRRLEDMDGDELKVMMLSLGLKTDKKKLKRDDVIRLIRTRMDEIEIDDDAE